MTPDDLRIVADDLQYLTDWGPEISDGEIRRGSAVLRRLLVENVYGQAWRAIGKPKQPTLIAVDISGNTDSGNLPRIKFALAAGAHFRGVKFAGLIWARDSNPPRVLGPPLRDNGYPGEKNLTLSEFLSSPSGVVDGQLFNRREVIKYIANVRGGVHLSSKRKKAEKVLVARLEKIEKRASIFQTDALLIELVAIGQALGSSSDAQDFIEQVTESI